MASSDQWQGLRLSEYEPKEWFVVFSEKAPTWWVRKLAFGRFKHVSVFGKVERSGSWVFHDIWLNRAQILVVGDWEADKALAHFIEHATIVRFPRMLADDHAVNLRPGAWCVPAVAQILGIRSCALRPDALFRQLLAKGGQVVGSEGRRDEAEDRERSGTGAPAAAGEPGEDQHDSGTPIDAD